MRSGSDHVILSSRAVCLSLLPCSHISLWKQSICHSLLLSRSYLQLSEEILISSLKCNVAEASKVFWEEQLQHSNTFQQKKAIVKHKKPPGFTKQIVLYTETSWKWVDWFLLELKLTQVQAVDIQLSRHYCPNGSHRLFPRFHSNKPPLYLQTHSCLPGVSLTLVTKN